MYSMVVAININDERALIVKRIILHRTSNVIDRSSSFLLQHNAFEHCWKRPVRFVVKLSYLTFQWLVEIDKMLVLRTKVIKIEISKSMANFWFTSTAMLEEWREELRIVLLSLLLHQLDVREIWAWHCLLLFTSLK